MITELIGDKWITDLYELKKLEQFIENDDVLNRLTEIKFNNKKKLAEYIKETTGIEVNPNSIFDVQVKRLHEYKRQLLNILHIMDLYNKLKENPLLDIEPRTFILMIKKKLYSLKTTKFHLQKKYSLRQMFQSRSLQQEKKLLEQEI